MPAPGEVGDLDALQSGEGAVDQDELVAAAAEGTWRPIAGAPPRGAGDGQTGRMTRQAVWAALRRIPTGQTTSYGAIARWLGQRAAVRAVGAANGQNPIALVVPCRRIIASDGTLCGYGGGLWRKEWLLRHERVRLA